MGAVWGVGLPPTSPTSAPAATFRSIIGRGLAFLSSYLILGAWQEGSAAEEAARGCRVGAGEAEGEGAERLIIKRGAPRGRRANERCAAGNQRAATLDPA